MTLSWLAALLRPRDIALHPNFSEDRRPTEQEVLASIVLGERLDNPDPFKPAGQPYPEWVKQAEAAIMSTTSEVAVRQLHRTITINSELAPGLAASLGLLACAMASETDEYDLCFDILNVCRERLRKSTVSSNDRLLLDAALDQQEALRRRDAGYEFAGLCERAAGNSQKFDPGASAKFAVSSGISWTSDETLRQIAALLSTSASSLVPHAPWDEARPATSMISSWQERVRSKPVESILRLDRQYGSVAADFIAREYSDLLRDTRTVIGGRGAADSFFVQLGFELAGNSRVYSSRKELAQMRMTQYVRGSAGFDPSDILRLLRHASAKNELTLAIRWVRLNGPLSALADDSRRIVRHRLIDNRINASDIRVLQAAAELLTPSEASAAFQCLRQAALAGGYRDLPGAREARSSKFGLLLPAASALANTSGDVNSMVRLLLRLLPTEGHDELLDRAFARAFDAIEWTDRAIIEGLSQVSALARQCGEYRALASAIQASPINAPVDEELVADDLGNIADQINMVIRGSATFPETSLGPDSVRILSGQLERIRENSANGMFDMTVTAPADLAACLIVYGGLNDMWRPLTEFLLDPRVRSTDRAPALDRLVFAGVALPPEIRDVFLGNIGSLTAAPPDPWDDGDGQLPEGIRFIVAMKLVPDTAAFSLVSELASSVGPESRKEAARTLAALASREEIVAEWVVSMAVLFSFDKDVEVQTGACRALIRTSQSNSKWIELISERLTAVLNEDGLLRPIALLSELSRDDLERLSSVRDGVSSLVDGHPSRLVRKAAAQLIEKS